MEYLLCCFLLFQYLTSCFYPPCPECTPKVSSQNQAQKDSESTHVLYLTFTFDTLANQLVVSQSEHFSIRCMLVPAYYSPFKHILYLYPAGNLPAYSYFSLSGTNDQITHAILDHLNAAAFCNTMFFHPFPDFCTCHHPLNSTDLTRLHFC